MSIDPSLKSRDGGVATDKAPQGTIDLFVQTPLLVPGAGAVPLPAGSSLSDTQKIAKGYPLFIQQLIEMKPHSATVRCHHNQKQIATNYLLCIR